MTDKEKIQQAVATLQMVKEELCFGGDWQNAIIQIDKTVAKLKDGKEGKEFWEGWT